MSCLRLRVKALMLSLAVPMALMNAGSAHAAQLGAAPALTVQPFTEPNFAAMCSWHEFGEGVRPPWWLLLVDPLCVEYSKRDITIDDGGALRFLASEPDRFAVTLLTCHYYQKDHWSVQSTTGATPWVTWDGQYWWDKAAQHAGARLTNFRIGGHTAGIGDAVAALRPAFPHLADALSDFGQAAGESGLTTPLPYDLRCALQGVNAP
ncbi:hypothetical protein ACIGBL_33745 [Streptomyces sp. NPDC085614]|uniref:hypothetical protein n=1 Tax=Streptomyces sp. NPDC085614 TaxID=3365733 RepID=UPI0037CD231B